MLQIHWSFCAHTAVGQGGQEEEQICYPHDVASLYLLWSCCGIEGNHLSSKGCGFG